MTTVLVVSTWNTACGIAEHTAYVKEALEKADPTIHVDVRPDLLSEQPRPMVKPDLLWLNYHAALHSHWTAHWIGIWREMGVPVLVTYHDTGVPNSDQCKAICAAATHYIVHEPCDDLPPNGEFLPQGIPPQKKPKRNYADRPKVGTVGFPFPWKNYDLLCKAAALAHWDVLLIAPGATPEQVQHWKSLNPHVSVIARFQPRDHVISLLSGCDATAFLYTCANTGTSGAIRQGIGARKPLLAFHPSICRQFRDLPEDCGITWLTNGSPEAVAEALRDVPDRADPRLLTYAQDHSWTSVGQRYAEIIRQMVKV